MAKAFADAQEASCVHSRNRLLIFMARLFFRDLYQIMRFYKNTTEETDINHLKEVEFPNAQLTSFPAFLDETKWGNPELSYKDLSTIDKVKDDAVADSSS